MERSTSVGPSTGAGPHRLPARHLILIGYRGTGKTTVARLLAERLGRPPADSDDLVQAKTGKSIAEIFERDGEAAFRDREAEAVAEALEAAESIVLATGGGAILRPETRALLRSRGHVVWLTATPETIFRRIRDDAASVTTRPGLTALPPWDEIVALLENRREYYAETAHVALSTDQIVPEEVARRILETY